MNNKILIGVSLHPQYGKLMPDGLLRVPVTEYWRDSVCIDIDAEIIEVPAYRDFSSDYQSYSLWLRLLQEKCDDIDLFDGFANGSLHFVVGTGRYINMDFHPFDWNSLFIITLKCPNYIPCPLWANEEEWYEYNRQRFKSAIPQYPLLGRVFSMYENTRYNEEEISQLSEECEEIKYKALNPEGVRAVRKLIFACSEAIQAKYSLSLECD